MLKKYWQMKLKYDDIGGIDQKDHLIYVVQFPMVKFVYGVASSPFTCILDCVTFGQGIRLYVNGSI